jgi:hypothetical protein
MYTYYIKYIMKSPLFLILVIILVLLLIERSSSKMPVSKPSNLSNAVSVGLPELNGLVRNVLSSSMAQQPQAQLQQPQAQLQQPPAQLQQPSVYPNLL